MVDKLGTKVNNHDFFNTSILNIGLPDECAKVFIQPIDMCDTINTHMANNEHHESQVAEMQLLKLETQIINTEVFDTQFIMQLVDI
jgi:hypothetical protein